MLKDVVKGLKKTFERILTFQKEKVYFFTFKEYVDEMVPEGEEVSEDLKEEHKRINELIEKF